MKEYIEPAHMLLVEGLAFLPANKLSGVPRYVRNMCAFISEAAGCFVMLRNADRITGSRVLIRPCIEAAMKLAAVKEDPNNLLNIAYTEAVGDGNLLEQYRDLAKEWLADGRPGVGPETVANAEQAILERKQIWGEVRSKLGPSFPNAPTVDKYIKPSKLAEAAKQSELYSTDYAFYHNFIHATLRVVDPWPDAVEGNDILAVAKCLRVALRSMEAIGGPKIPQELATKLDALVPPPKP